MPLNFLEEQTKIFHEDFQPKRGASPWVIVGWVAVFFLVLLVVSLLVAGQVLAGVLDGRDALERAKDNMAKVELQSARQNFLDAENNFSKASKSLKLFTPLKLVPWVGDQYDAVAAILKAGKVSSGALAELLYVGSDVLRLAGEDEDVFKSESGKNGIAETWSALDEQSRKQILDRLYSSLSVFDIAQNEIYVISEDLRNDTGGELIGFIETQRDTAVEQLQTIQKILGIVTQAVAMIPVVSDEDGGRILLLFLNNDELRPAGGFIGSFGIVKIKNGFIEPVEVYDVMDVDSPVLKTRTVSPPSPLNEYLGVPAWFFRDANWSPDFVESASLAEKFFYDELYAVGDKAVIDPNLKFDAVIGVTTRFAADLLSVIGDVKVGNDVFTKDNISDALANAVEFTFLERGVPFEKRKDIIQDIVDEVRDRLIRIDFNEARALFTHLGNRLEDKNVLLYSSREDLMSLFDRYGWTGRVETDYAHDYLMVVDANMAALKTDPAVRRSVTYSLRPDGGGLIATVKIRYDHTQNFAPKVTRYRTYTRLYVPLGSELISTSGTLSNDKLKNPAGLEDDVTVSNDLGKTVFGMFTSIEPMTSRELVVSYKLPKNISNEVLAGEYGLLVQKQSGAQDNALTLDLDFGTTLERATPAEEAGEWGDGVYHLNTILDQDREINVQL